MIGSKAMRELSSLKQELKCWENMFERTHGRKPSKDDISTGSEEIRESYKRYRVLKESLLKRETVECQQDDSEEVFGKNLNKKKADLKLSTIPFHAKEWADITPVRLCHGQRPKKRADKSPTKEKVTEDNVDKDVLHVKQCESTEKEATALINLESNLQDVRVVDTSEHTLKSLTQKRTGSSFLLPNHQSRNVRFKKRGAISSAWLQKCKPELPPNEDHQVLNLDELQENLFESENIPSNEQANVAIEKVLDKENCTFARQNEINVGSLSEIDLETQKNAGVAKDSIGRKMSPGTGFKADKKWSVQESSNKEDDKTVTSKYKERENKTHPNAKQHLKVRDLPQTSQEKCLTGSVSVADPFESDQMRMKTDPLERTGEASQEISSHKRKADERTFELEKPQKKLRCENDHEEQVHEESKWEDEEKKNLSNIAAEPELPLRTAKVKVSSGLVSDNFQKLNMKHRSYRRRGGGISGSAHKRRAWKQIMKSRGEFVPQKSWSSRGQSGRGGRSGTCFKCGQEGHWAKNCRGPKKSQAGPKMENSDQENDGIDMDEFEPLPSIEEAALMAAGIHRDDVPQGENLAILPHKLPRPVVMPPTPPPAVEPFYQPVDGKPVDTTNEVLSSLEKLGFSSFRSGQQEAVMRILCGMSSLVVLSTGAGKSLCYQLPAFMYAQRSSCLTLVISPLVSLMEDQITGLPHGLKGACLHTNLTKAQRQKVVEDLCSGKVSVLLLSPEALVGGGSGNGCLPSVSQLPQIAFACIDEAHCVSEWSHNFRPSYLRVCKVLREKFGVRCFLGLTATATRATAASVAEHLGIAHDPEAVIRGGAVPPNLVLSVSCDTDKTQALLQLLQGRRFLHCDSIIIYCTRREQTEKLASTLRTCLQSTRLASGWNGLEESVDEGDTEEPGKTKTKSKGKRKKKTAKATVPKWDAECYHAGLSAAQRRRVQKRFMTGQLRIVVATVAFGMGLDKSDVRAIIHYNLPRSFESYVQEIGRAGRDGNPSHCHVFLDPEGKDMSELRRHVYANTVDRSSLKKLVQRTFPRCDCRELQRQQKERQQVAVKSDSNDYLDLEGDYDNIIDTTMEAELQALEQKYQRELEVREDTDERQKIEREEGSELNLKLDEPDIDPLGDNNIEHPSLENSVKGTLDSNPPSESNTSAKSTEFADNNLQPADQVNAHRVCGGHPVAMVTDFIVQELDLREESIATLLCYLELHPSRWLEVLQPVKSTCTVKFYGGHAQLREVAQKIPPIAAAVSHTSTTPASFKKSGTLTFPVVELADKMGWDLAPVCRELRALQWNTSLSREHSLSNMGQSGILVEFSDLSIHVRAPGDLSDSERDSICDFLEDRILAEERTQLQQLQFVYDSLKSVSFSEFWQCADAVDDEADNQLKRIVKSYFEDCNDKTKEELATLTEARKASRVIRSSITREDHVNWDGIARDIRALLGVHHDHSFTGRAVARIFHGIDSPCYPAEVWGRDRRFWRKHLDVEFNSLRKFATQELIRFR